MEMIHLFINHSNLTKLIINGILKHQKIHDYLVLNTRGTDFFDNPFSFNCDYPYPAMGYSNRVNLINLFNKIRNLNILINSKTGGRPFILYAPNHSEELIFLLKNNPNCIEINYIEDGLGSYATEESLNKKYERNKPLNFFQSCIGFVYPYFNIKWHRDGFISRDTSKLFVLSNESVSQNTKIKIVLDAKTVFGNDLSVDTRSRDNIKEVFVFDAGVDFGVYGLDYLIKCFNIWLNTTKSYIVFVKFHPSQEQSQILQFVKILEKRGNFRILSNDVIIESVSFKKKLEKQESLVLYGVSSVLLFYNAFFFGGKSFAYIDEFVNPKVNLPDIFYEYVETL